MRVVVEDGEAGCLSRGSDDQVRDRQPVLATPRQLSLDLDRTREGRVIQRDGLVCALPPRPDPSVDPWCPLFWTRGGVERFEAL